MNAYRKLLTCLVALFTLAGCGGRGAAPTPTLVPTPIVAQKPTYTVQRGTVTKSLELAGRVTPVRQQEMFFRTDGYVKAVYFQRGEAVKAGDVLAELETGDLAIQSAQAQLALQVAQAKLVQAQQENADALIEARLALDRANLQALQAGALGVAPSIAEAEASVARAEQKLARAETANREAQANRGLSEEEKAEFRRAYEEAKRQLENARALLIAETDLAAAQEAMQAAKEADQAAQTNLNLTDEEKAAFVEAYEKAKSAYVSAWMAYAEALGGKFPLGFSARAAGMEAALARLQVEKLLRGVDPLLALEVEQARLNLQSLQEKVENARLVAPFDGQILSLGIAPGSQISAFRAVLTLADPSAMEITAIPSPEELSDLGVSQAAVVRLSAQPGKAFSARISALPLVSGESPAGNQDQAVHITLDDPSTRLTLGEAATVVIEIETRQNVLWLPPAALRTFQGQDFVFIETNGVQRRVNVRLGLKSAERVEILEGLEEGQVVVGP